MYPDGPSPKGNIPQLITFSVTSLTEIPSCTQKSWCWVQQPHSNRLGVRWTPYNSLQCHTHSFFFSLHFFLHSNRLGVRWTPYNSLQCHIHSFFFLSPFFHVSRDKNAFVFKMPYWFLYRVILTSCTCYWTFSLVPQQLGCALLEPCTPGLYTHGSLCGWVSNMGTCQCCPLQ